MIGKQGQECREEGACDFYYKGVRCPECGSTVCILACQREECTMEDDVCTDGIPGT